MGKAREWRVEHLNKRGISNRHTMVLSKTRSSCYPSKLRQGLGLKEQWPGAMHDTCYVEQQCLVFLMSADAMG